MYEKIKKIKNKKISKYLISVYVYTTIFAVILIILLPALFMVAGSFMPETQVSRIFFSGNVLDLRLIPVPFTTIQYTSGLIQNTTYINGFWNSIILSFPIALLQTFFAFLASWALAKLQLPFSNVVFAIYIILFLTPYQVLQVPHYIMMRQFNLLGTMMSIILPNIFSALGVCLITPFLKSIPDEIIESAMIEGCGTFKILYYIGFYISKPILICTFMLIFIDSWNLIEQPFIFLNNNTDKYPLSVLLSVVTSNDIYSALAFSILYTVPVLLIYLFGEEYLSDCLTISISEIHGGEKA